MQHRCTNVGANNAGDQYLESNAQTLEHARFAGGNVVADHGAEDGGTGEVAAHHQQRADENEQLALTEEQQKEVGYLS